MSDLQPVWARIDQHSTTLARILEAQENMRAMFASREWVHDELKPIRELLTQLAHSQEEQTKKQSDLFAAHEKMIIDEAARKEERHQEELEALRRQTFSALLGNWAKVAGYFSVIVGFIIMSGPSMAAWLQAVLHAK